MSENALDKVASAGVAESHKAAPFTRWSMDWAKELPMVRRNDRRELFPTADERPPTLTLADTMGVLVFVARDGMSQRTIILNRSSRAARWQVMNSMTSPLAVKHDSKPDYWVDRDIDLRRPTFHLTPECSGTVAELNEMFAQL